MSNEERKNIFKKMEKPWRDYKASYKFWDVIHTDEGGFVENEVEIHVKPDEICIWQGDDVVYLDNQQLRNIINILSLEGFVPGEQLMKEQG